MTLLKTFPVDPDTGYGFEWLRAMLEVSPLQEGVIGAGDFKTTAAAAGGQRVDVAAGWALIKGDSGLPALGITQGLYLQGNDAPIANALTLANGGANPRVDQVVLTVSDTSDLGSASNAPALAVVQGAEAAGATLDNRAVSAAALPPNSVRLADVLVPAGSSVVTAGNVRDRRPWARGAFRQIVRNANGAAGNDYTYTSATLGLVDAANLAPRIECSGAPIRVTLDGTTFHSVANALDYLGFYIDSAGPDGAASGAFGLQETTAAANVQRRHVETPTTPTAGSHVIAPVMGIATAGTMTLAARANIPVVLTIEERPRQNADNT